MTGTPLLIVDDNPINLKLAKVTLMIAGYDVHTACNAEEALAVLKSFKPALILMDIQMPGMDGLELTRQLKSDKQFKEILIIAVTSYAMKGDEEKMLAAGCDGYISKPIDTQTLPLSIENYLKKGLTPKK